MRILHLSKDDIGGGAGIAAFRLHQGLRKSGVDSRMLVMDKQSNDDYVTEVPQDARYYLNKLGGRIENQISNAFLDDKMHWDISLTPTFLKSLIGSFQPDVLNLHWINRGMISLPEISSWHWPIVWTQHDMWAATSGYHYYGDTLCDKFIGDEAIFDANVSEKPLAKWLLRKKTSLLSQRPMKVVCPSKWLENIFQATPTLIRRTIHHIPYGLDTEIYHPSSKKERARIRQKYQISEWKRVILFGAASSSADPRKGSDLLVSAIQKGILDGTLDPDRVELAVFGQQDSLEELHGLKVHSLGNLKEGKELAEAYRLTDVFIAPSREDNLPNTVLEALACGVPTVAFEIGGMPDMIAHCETGYLAEPFKVDRLLDGIDWVLGKNDSDFETMREKCRDVALSQYPLLKQAQSYAEVYRCLIDGEAFQGA